MFKFWFLLQYTFPHLFMQGFTLEFVLLWINNNNSYAMFWHYGNRPKHLGAKLCVLRDFLKFFLSQWSNSMCILHLTFLWSTQTYRSNVWWIIWFQSTMWELKGLSFPCLLSRVDHTYILWTSFINNFQNLSFNSLARCFVCCF